MDSNIQLNPNLHSFKRQMMAWHGNKTDVRRITKHLNKSTTQKVNCRLLLSCVTEFTHHWYELPCHDEGKLCLFGQYVCRTPPCSASQRTMDFVWKAGLAPSQVNNIHYWLGCNKWQRHTSLRCSCVDDFKPRTTGSSHPPILSQQAKPTSLLQYSFNSITVMSQWFH